MALHSYRTDPNLRPVPAQPPGMKYARLVHDLRPGEGVLMLRRRHPYFLVVGVAVPLLLVLLWAARLTFMPGVLAGLVGDPISAREGAPTWMRVGVAVGWVGLGVPGVVWGVYALLGWLGRWIAITTRRVIVMDKLPLLRESRREAPLQKVQNVVAVYPHLLGTSLDFGTLTVDTAGVGVLEFDGLPQPKWVREAIFAQQAALGEDRPDPEERRRAAIRGILRGGAMPPGAGHTQVTRLESAIELPPEEPPTFVWRRHPYFLVRSLALPLLAWGFALAVWLGVGMSGGGALGELSGWVAVLGAPFVAGWVVWSIEDWRNDRYVLDQERVYHVESLPLGFREQSKETLIARITDVTYLVPGPLANLLDFGDVSIKTPGEATEFLFAGIPQPREVHAEIMARLDEHRLRQAEGVDDEIEGWLRAWHEVGREGQF